MAATTFEALSFADVPVHEHNRVIKRVSRDQEWTLDEANDVVKFFRLPSKGFKITNVGIIADSLDSNASKTITLDVVLTDGTTTHTIISASTIARAGGVIDAWTANSAGFKTLLQAGVLKGEGWTLQIKVNAAPATVAAGSLQAMVEYTCDTEAGELKRRS